MRGRFGVALAACVLACGWFAGESSALAPWLFVKVTPQGPVPRVLHAVAGFTPIAWYDEGASGRRVVFADGSCRRQVAGRSGPFVGCVLRTPGRYVYRIEGLPGPVATGVVIVRPARPGERYGPPPVRSK